MDILVYYDGSSYSKRALATGIHFGKSVRAKLHLMAAAEADDAVGGPADIQNGQDASSAADKMEEALRMVHEANLPCKTYTLNQDESAGENIVDFAQQVNAAYVVMGMPSPRSDMGRGDGRITQYVVTNSPCPVMTVN